jgi:hypothetical protein
MDDGTIWSEASVTSADWSGSAQLDQRRTVDLAGMIGLDAEEWLIVGLDIQGTEHGHSLRVLAVRADSIPEAADLFRSAAAAGDGEIRATEFLVRDVDPYRILRACTQELQLRMRARGTREFPIRIVSQSEIREQA